MAKLIKAVSGIYVANGVKKQNVKLTFEGQLTPVQHQYLFGQKTKYINGKKVVPFAVQFKTTNFYADKDNGTINHSDPDGRFVEMFNNKIMKDSKKETVKKAEPKKTNSENVDDIIKAMMTKIKKLEDELDTYKNLAEYNGLI